jgi:TPR repeat protein
MITQIRGAIPAIVGALLASALCVGIAVGFLRWRADAQKEILSERKTRCSGGDAAACDLLRSACLKRVGEACVALAESHLASGPRHDGPEGARLLAEACDHHVIEACRRAASLYEEGREVPPERDRAAALMQRACTFGDKAACAKGP